MQFKARIILSVLCIITFLTSIHILDSFKSIAIYMRFIFTNLIIPQSKFPWRVNKMEGDRVKFLFKRNNTDHQPYVHNEKATELAVNQMNYPLGIKIGILVQVVTEVGTIGVEQRVGDRYSLCRRIGGGIFGHIFLGIDRASGEKVAVKVDRSEQINSTVSKEGNIYRMFIGGKGFPTSSWQGREGNFNIVVMDLLGPNLQRYFALCGYRFSLKTVLLLADQMISRLEYVHYKGFIHRDVSPANFVVGLNENRHTIYNIDFGFAERYRDPKTARHVPYRYVGFAGTERYSSLNAHKGYQQSRRDDMESLGYVLIYFLKGRLPWQRIQSSGKSQQFEQKLHMKQYIAVTDLCKGLPVAFSEYLHRCRSMRFEEEPAYSRLRNLFREAFRRHNFTSNGMFDWDANNGTCKSNDESTGSVRCIH